MLRFDELNTETRQTHLIGKKAESLIALRAGGFPVPDGFVIPADALSRLQSSDLIPYIEETQCYAVRSSGTQEDLANSSFAGQYDSFLNVQGLDNLYDAIQNCAKSAHSSRVLAYAQRSGIQLEEGQMAVIVQHMVPAEKAGVAFSVNSIAGHDKEVLIEAVHGLGEQLVSGHVTPDSYAVDWFQETIQGPYGGVLTREEVQALTKLVVAVQVFYGFPVDVEWAIAGGELFLLQSRPITTMLYRDIQGEWTTADFRDGGVSASVCKPLMASLYGLCFNDAILKSFQEVTIASRAVANMYDVFFARPYWNWSITKAGFAKLPGFVERKMDEDMGLSPNYEGDGLVTKKTLKTMSFALRALFHLSRHYRNMSRTVTQKHQDLTQRLKVAEQQNLEPLSTHALHDLWCRFIREDYHLIECTYFRYITCTVLLSSDFKDKLSPVLSEPELLTLISGLADVSHMRPIYELWDLSRKQDGVSEAEFQAFLQKYQHHSEHELDISFPNWGEAPETVRAQIHEFSRLDDANNPAHLNQIQRQKYQQLRSRLPKPLHKTVDRFRLFLWWRDEFKDLSTKAYNQVRRFSLALGRALTASGALESPDDIFYLSVSEVEQQQNLRALVARNKNYLQSFRNFKNPNELGTRFQFTQTREQPTGTLKGVPCSGSTIQGIARVIKDIHDAQRLQPGDILVTTYTDPAWTAVFSKIAGVITETGGILSHAAVVSREYGLPCILVAKHATSILKDGQRITMNCETGEIFPS